MPEPDDTPIPLTDRLTSGLFLGIMRLAALLPYERRIPAVGWVFAHLLAPLAGYRRRVIANLERARPDLPPDQARAVAAAVADNAGRSLAEIYAGPEFAARIAAADPLTGPGLPALAEAVAAQRPVVLAVAHFGNYDAMRAALVARGWPVGALYRPMNNAAFNRHYVRAMTGIAEPMFPRGKAGLAGMLRFLKGGGMLALAFDQFHQDGTLLSFFDLPTRTVLTPAELAIRYDALLVSAHGIRQPDGLSFRVEIGAPIPHTTPEAMMQALNDGLEHLIRAHMGQWFWVHRRWK